MDATCFHVDWLTQTGGPTLGKSSGHWSHILTCAHVVCPWNYPNYYPPRGPTRYVSHITLADTMTQIRASSLQGQIIYKHFTSNQHVFVHSNPRLDLCVLHAEQNFKRSGEMRMLWMQNEGLIKRPRMELAEELQVGDYVWIYGMTAHESLFDEEKGAQPLMVPTGVQAKVHMKTREHFFLETLGVEGSDRGKIAMGMCGSVVVRNGKCVGMLTATVHEDSPCKELAGTAMCTYARDIFEFLIEVEKQMKTLPDLPEGETEMSERRKAEGCAGVSHKDWSLDTMRLARHVPCPSSLFHVEESWITDEDQYDNQYFSRAGIFNQETQENMLGCDMNSSTNKGRPENIAMFNTKVNAPTAKPVASGERKDESPDKNIYGDDEEFKRKDQWDSDMLKEVRSMFDSSVKDEKEMSTLDAMRRSLEQLRADKHKSKMKETVFAHTGANKGKTDPLFGEGAGRDREGAKDSFGEAAEEMTELLQKMKKETSDSPDPKHSKDEKERKYQEELRKRHKGAKGFGFGDADDDLWGRH